jgi:DNA-binding NarL/FixJ family response regulator
VPGDAARAAEADGTLVALAQLVRDGVVGCEDDDETKDALEKALAIHEADSLAAHDREVEDFLDDDMRARLKRMDAKNAETRRVLKEAAAVPLPDISHEDQIAHAAARWQQLGEATDIPDDAREILLRLLVAGTTIKAVAEALEVSKWTARTYLERLRTDGLVRMEGEKRTARWLLAEPGGGDSS